MDRPDIPQRQIVVATACILDGEKVLLGPRRAPGMPEIDGRLDLPGGRVEFGEAPRDAAVREVFEETGLVVVAERMVPFVHVNVWRYPDRTQHTLVLCYLCGLAGGVTGMEVSEGEWEWMRLEEVDLACTLCGVDRFLAWVAAQLASRTA